MTKLVLNEMKQLKFLSNSINQRTQYTFLYYEFEEHKMSIKEMLIEILLKHVRIDTITTCETIRPEYKTSKNTQNAIFDLTFLFLIKLGCASICFFLFVKLKKFFCLSGTSINGKKVDGFI